MSPVALALRAIALGACLSLALAIATASYPRPAAPGTTTQVNR